MLAAVAQVLLYKLVPADGGNFLGFANTSLVSIISQLIGSFGLAVAIIGGEAAWRYGKAPFDDAYAAAKRRGGDIFVASIGYSFIVYIAALVGGTVGPWGSVALSAVASVFCVYMLPAAAIGGIPGGASLQISAERVRNAPITAIVIALVYFVSIALVPTIVTLAFEPFLLSWSFFGAGDVSSLIVALIKALMWAYVGIVLAKTYGDASIGRFRRY